MESQAKIQHKVQEPVDKATYGQAYHNKDRMSSMKVGYVHPYHTEDSPLFFSHMYFMKNLHRAIGPEQVSPHYETFSRSRRGVIFAHLYICSIVQITQLGSMDNNEWLRGMIWHHEFLLAYYIGYMETKHFFYFFGPKFNVFYSNYVYLEL
jgi:hypothetical protein